MIAVVIKDGEVIAKVSLPDGTVKILATPNEANVFDLHDGVSFSKNPKEAELKAQALKKQQVLGELQKADIKQVAQKLKDLSDANPVEVKP